MTDSTELFKDDPAYVRHSGQSVGMIDPSPVRLESEPVMSTKESWKAFGIRAFKTFIQGATAVLLANALDIFDATAWEAAITGGFGAIVSFLNNWSSAAEAPKATTGS